MTWSASRGLEDTSLGIREQSAGSACRRVVEKTTKAASGVTVHRRSQICIRQVCHEEGRYEREPCRLDDETDAEIEYRAAHKHHGLRVLENRDKSVEVSIGENLRAFQIAALAGAGVEMFYGRQPRARGRVLTCGAETGIVHDS